MLLNEICGKKIINSLNAKYEGILTGALVSRDLKIIKAFKAGVITTSDDGIRSEKQIYIDPSCIFSFKDALVTTSLKEIEYPNTNESLDAPLGVPVFNINGLMYGYLIDICFNKAFKVTKLVYDRPFVIRRLVSVSNDIIIANAVFKKTAVNTVSESTDKETFSFTNSLQVVNDDDRPKRRLLNRLYLKNVSNGYGFSDVAENHENFSEDLALNGRFISDKLYYSRYPKKLICGYSFLLGRTVGSDIRNAKNEVLINRGTVITDKIVEKAGEYGKLVELTFLSVK
ncbi:MAG: hypothetical protein LBP79_01860 [Clostridiales bacterium]|jgi:hypothetical protein|nr:hypothetical protein [Clostridiales bacterium]